MKIGQGLSELHVASLSTCSGALLGHCELDDEADPITPHCWREPRQGLCGDSQALFWLWGCALFVIHRSSDLAITATAPPSVLWTSGMPLRHQKRKKKNKTWRVNEHALTPTFHHCERWRQTLNQTKLISHGVERPMLWYCHAQQEHSLLPMGEKATCVY